MTSLDTTLDGMTACATARMVCHWCGQPLHYVRNRGYVHPEGGSYMMYCKECGWSGAPWPSPRTCPKCGSAEIRDDHCALPERG